MKPEISVVMSAYNDEKHIERSVRSLLEQSFSGFELIVVNDGSTDRTLEILEQFAASDSRLRIIDQKNTGLTRALIRGCEEAAGEFIARQDADDWSAPERLLEQLKLIQSDSAIGFVSCATSYVGPAEEPLETITRNNNSQIATEQLLNEKMGPPHHGSVMFRKSVYQKIGGYRPEFYYGQDSDLWLRMAEVRQIAYAEKVLYFARRDMHSISGAQRPVQKKFGLLGQALRTARKNQLPESDLLAQARALTADVIANRKAGKQTHLTQGEWEMAYLLGSQLTQLRDRRGIKYLWSVIKHRPFHWRAWIRLTQLFWCGKLISSAEKIS